MSRDEKDNAISTVLVSQDDKPRCLGIQEKPVYTIWKIVLPLVIDESAMAREANRGAHFLIATNVPSTHKLSDEALFAAYKEQSGVEQGFCILKDPPLFLESSTFTKKPSHLIALGLIIEFCLLVYHLAEHRLEQSEETIPNQVNKPIAKPTMHWIFQCFEGIKLLHIRIGLAWQTRILRLQPFRHKTSCLPSLAYQLFFFCLLGTAKCRQA